MSIHTDNIEKLIDYSNKELQNVEFNENNYEVDLVFNSTEDVSDVLFEIGRLNNLWGQGLDEPLLVIEEIKLYPEDVSFIGKTADTSKFTINGVSFLKFKDLDFVNAVKAMKNGFAITIVGKANINEWNGNFSPQIFIVDYQIRDTSYDF